LVKITTAGALYAHAIAIEREAAERYTEFSERMEDLGNAGAAEVFARLAGLEAEHLDALLQRTEGIALPRLDETTTAGSTPARPKPRRASSSSASCRRARHSSSRSMPSGAPRLFSSMSS